MNPKFIHFDSLSACDEQRDKRNESVFKERLKCLGPENLRKVLDCRAGH